MGKVYAPPVEIKHPEFTAKDYFKAEENYINAVVAWAKQHGKGKLAGEVIQFPVADGYAQYVVFSTTPVALIHLPIGDAWQYQYANRLTASDIKEKVRQSQAMAKLFGKE